MGSLTKIPYLLKQQFSNIFKWLESFLQTIANIKCQKADGVVFLRLTTQREVRLYKIV